MPAARVETEMATEVVVEVVVIGAVGAVSAAYYKSFPLPRCLCGLRTAGSCYEPTYFYNGCSLDATMYTQLIEATPKVRAGYLFCCFCPGYQYFKGTWFTVPYTFIIP